MNTVLKNIFLRRFPFKLTIWQPPFGFHYIILPTVIRCHFLLNICLQTISRLSRNQRFPNIVVFCAHFNHMEEADRTRHARTGRNNQGLGGIQGSSLILQCGPHTEASCLEPQLDSSGPRKREGNLPINAGEV